MPSGERSAKLFHNYLILLRNVFSRSIGRTNFFLKFVQDLELLSSQI